MSEVKPVAAATATVNLALSLGADTLCASITMPTAPLPLDALRPVFRSLAEAVIARAVDADAKAGHSVSCRPGCGACCHQLVPLTEAEARQIAALVDALPAPRRAEVLARFAAARAQLEGTQVLELMLHPERFSEADFLASGLPEAYFRLGIACPFLLADQNCSIHPERPMACREYLVSSPAANCAVPWDKPIRRVPLAAKVSTAVTLLGVAPGQRFARWVPLLLALDWTAEHAHDDLPPRPGPEWLGEFVGRMTGTTVAVTPPSA